MLNITCGQKFRAGFYSERNGLKCGGFCFVKRGVEGECYISLLEAVAVENQSLRRK